MGWGLGEVGGEGGVLGIHIYISMAKRRTLFFLNRSQLNVHISHTNYSSNLLLLLLFHPFADGRCV
jgi:hypothetical protein